MKHLLILTLLFGCGHFEKRKYKEPGEYGFEELIAKGSELYLPTVDELEDNFWPSSTDCDGTLWAGLACAANLPQNIKYAEYKPGEIHRRPAPSCYTDRDMGAKTTVSRDMLTGYMACQWQLGDVGALKRLAEYGQTHSWIVSRVAMGTNLQSLLGQMIYKLSNGKDSRFYRHIPASYTPVTKDYERHIQTQGILLYGMVNNVITDQMFDRLKEHAAAYPEDFLFSYVLGRYTGDQKNTVDMLLAFDGEKPSCSSYVRGEKPDLYCKILWHQVASNLLIDIYRAMD
jgi:hypothetical protein